VILFSIEKGIDCIILANKLISNIENIVNYQHYDSNTLVCNA